MIVLYSRQLASFHLQKAWSRLLWNIICRVEKNQPTIVLLAVLQNVCCIHTAIWCIDCNRWNQKSKGLFDHQRSYLSWNHHACINYKLNSTCIVVFVYKACVNRQFVFCSGSMLSPTVLIEILTNAESIPTHVLDLIEDKVKKCVIKSSDIKHVM